MQKIGKRIRLPIFGTPDAIRTHDLQSRSLTLYPTELQAHICELESILIIAPPGRKSQEHNSRKIKIRCAPGSHTTGKGGKDQPQERAFSVRFPLIQQIFPLFLNYFDKSACFLQEIVLL